MPYTYSFPSVLGLLSEYGHSWSSDILKSYMIFCHHSLVLWGLSCQQFFSGTARLCIACLCIVHTLSLWFGVIEILKSRARLENLHFRLGVDLLMRVMFLKESLSHLLSILILKCKIKKNIHLRHTHFHFSNYLI